MGISYCGVIGFGIKNIEQYLSEEKIKTLYEELLECEMDIFTYVHECYNSGYTSNAGKGRFYFSEDYIGHYCFLYLPSLYFDMIPQEKAFTCKEDIAVAMFEALKEVLKDNITVEHFKQNIDWVSTWDADY